ncbi:hypothetical protein BKP42_67860 [Rhodococcus erythropolis]|nr:hypothetical protein BKP42_67860 [Rhodococcus erythropolis]
MVSSDRAALPEVVRSKLSPSSGMLNPVTSTARIRNSTGLSLCRPKAMRTIPTATRIFSGTVERKIERLVLSEVRYPRSAKEFRRRAVSTVIRSASCRRRWGRACWARRWYTVRVYQSRVSSAGPNGRRTAPSVVIRSALRRIANDAAMARDSPVSMPTSGGVSCSAEYPCSVEYLYRRARIIRRHTRVRTMSVTETAV